MERSSGLEGLSNYVKEREDDREHVAGNVSGRATKFNWLNQYGFFGRDSMRWNHLLDQAARS